MTDDKKKVADAAATTKIPAEILLRATKGQICYAGIAACFTIADEQVIVVARTIPQMNIVFNKLFPNATLRTTACPEVVILPRSGVDLDEEL